ncbi:calcium-binding protein [Nocardioides sp. WG-D5]
MVLLTGRTLLAGIVAMAASATVLVASPASAATTSTGVRCTIVGTSGGDVLNGTSRRDVICGRGGSDIIYARSGDDMVDGGGGDDRIYGSYGADKLLGGTGRDSIRGEAGADVVYGGSSSDFLYGGTSDDTIRGGSGNDQIQGDDGHDHIYGEADHDKVSGGTGWDVLYGGTGRDHIVGGNGNDRAYGGDNADGLYGGAGNDQLYGGNHNDLLVGGYDDDRAWGGAGADQIRGESGTDNLTGESGSDLVDGGGGNDTITGGSGTDELRGGSGTNRCVYDIYDLLSGCGADKEAPEVIGMSVSPSSADVTGSSVTVKVRSHVTDDLNGVSRVEWTFSDNNNGVALNVEGRLVSGGLRDGWWEGILTVPRYAAPQTLSGSILLQDTARELYSIERGSLNVVNDGVVDDSPPQLSVVTLSPSSVDVRSASKSVKVAIRAVDPLAGVDRVDICILKPVGTDWRGNVEYDGVSCTEVVPLASGSVRDGIYTTTLAIPKGSPSGTYVVAAYTIDKLGQYAHWESPDAFKHYEESGTCCNIYALPEANTRLQVTGS